MNLPRARPQTKITIDDVLTWADYSNENYATFAHFVNTATNNKIAARDFLEYARFNYGLYVLNYQTVCRLSAPFTPESFSEAFAECFGTGAGFTDEIKQYLDYITDQHTTHEEITREGENGKNRTSTNSGGIATTKDQTTTRTPTGNVTTTTTPTGTVQTAISNVLSETVNVSLGSWDSTNLQGSEQTVTSGTPSSTETVTDNKVITEVIADSKVVTERVTGNASTTTDTRENEVEESGTHEETETRDKTESGLNNEIIKRSILSYFARQFVNTFCISCYDIDNIKEW